MITAEQVAGSIGNVWRCGAGNKIGNQDPLYGLDVNPASLTYECNNCIAACCHNSGFNLLYDKEICTMISRGTVWHCGLFPETRKSNGLQAYCEPIRGANPLDDVVDLIVQQVRDGRYLPDVLRRIRNRTKKYLFDSYQERCGSKLMLGYCGCVDQSTYRCSIHDTRLRNQVCADVAPGDEYCRRRFIARGSPAAQVLIATTQEAQQYLDLLNRTIYNQPFVT